MAETSKARSAPWAIALVHGIGTTSPLPMIEEVGDALKTVRPDLTLNTEAEVHEVRASHDHHEEDAHPRYTVIRHGTINGADVRIGAAHWADITFYRRGLVNLIGALMMTAFGVRFFAQVAASALPGENIAVRGLAGALRLVLQFMVQVLALIIFPVTLAALVFSCTGLLAEYVFKVRTFFLQKEAIAVIGFSICATLAGIGLYRTKDIRDERPLSFWIFAALGTFAFVIGALMLVGNNIWIGKLPDTGWQAVWHVPKDKVPVPQGEFLPLPDRLRDALEFLARYFDYLPLADRIRIVDKTGVYFALMHVLQLAAGMLMISLTLLALILLASLSVVARITHTPIRTFVFATVSVVTIWIINLVLLWPENLATFAAMTEFLDDGRESSIIAMTTIDWKTWTVDKTPLDLAIDKDMRTGFMLQRHYSDTYPLMWFEGAFLIFLFMTLVLVIAVLIARSVWCAWHSKAKLDPFAIPHGAARPLRANWPRVIISKGYVFLVMLLIICVPTLFVAQMLRNTDAGAQFAALIWLGQKLPHEISVGAEWARVLLIAFLALFLLYSQYISDGAKLVLDVVNHFTAPKLGFPVRNRIHRRFEEIIRFLLLAGDKPNLVIVAHSQGTVITIDALMNEEWVEDILQRVSTLTILTFGSPITHVYQEYFPQLYPSFASTNLARLSRNDRVKWYNIYRIDDYVGTFVDNSIQVNGGFPVNVPAPPGGHTDYWEEAVFEQLFKQPGMQSVLKAVPLA